jgi:hypothetical protein
MIKPDKDKSTVRSKKDEKSVKVLENQLMDQSSIENMDNNKEELLLDD